MRHVTHTVLTVSCCHEQAHLKPFLPTHPMVPTGGLPKYEGDEKAFGTMAAAPFGSSLILPISYAYISMMGSEGLTEVTALPLSPVCCTCVPSSPFSSPFPRVCQQTSAADQNTVMLGSLAGRGYARELCLNFNMCP